MEKKTAVNVEKLRDHLTCRQPKRVSWKLCQHEGRLTLEQPRPRFLKHIFSVSFSSWRFSATTQRTRSTFRRRQVGSLGKSGSEASSSFSHFFHFSNSPNSLWGYNPLHHQLVFLGEGHLWWVQEKPARSWTSDRQEEQEPRNSLHYSQAIKDTSWYCNIIFSAIRQ